MKNSLFSFLSVTTLFLYSSLTNAEKISFPIDVGVRPESITQGFGNHYFVSVMNDKESGDGVIKKIDRKTGEVSVFATGFDEPKGITYVKGNLYTTDLTRVWKIDKKGKTEIFADMADFPFEPQYLNDIAASPKEDGVYVVDMGGAKFMRNDKGELWPVDSEEARKIPQLGRIYFMAFKGKGKERVKEVISPSPLMLNPNGVAIDKNKKLMVAEFFYGKVLVTNTKGELEPLKGEFRGADAIEQDKKGHYYLSSWAQGKVWKIDGVTQEATVITEGHKSAADFFLDRKNNRLLLPDMLSGTINEIKLTDCRK
jgi:sugar lactone lactonase YvrE